MTSSPISASSGKISCGVSPVWWIPVCFAFVLWSQAVFAAGTPVLPAVSEDSQEAWLITFGPGDVYFERFGHNAIWLREPAIGLDHTFNFGYFDFEQEDFFLQFMRGRMLYFSIAQPADREFKYYQKVNRSIRAQKLKLTPLQFQKLRDYLLNEVQPENRDYRYDYYLNNCSTRIRDALDMALDGSLSASTETLPATLNFRDQTRRLTQMQFWYYLGLETGLGYPVDRVVSRWDEMFIPMVVADEIAMMSLTQNGSEKPLVEVDTMFFTSTSPAPADTPSTVWYRYLLLGLLVSGLAWLSAKFMPPVWLDGLCGAWILITATLGLILSALWFLTDHEVSRYNANLLLLNPFLMLAIVPKLRRVGAVILIGGVMLALILLVLANSQYNPDVIALLGPINLAVALYLLKKRPIDT